MKRTKSLVANIFQTITSIIGFCSTAVSAYLVFVVIVLAGSIADDQELALLGSMAWVVLICLGLLAALYVVSFIFSCINYGVISSPAEVYKKKKRFCIANIVINAIVLALSIFACFYATDASSLVVNISMTVIYAIVVVLFSVDLHQEKNRVVERQPTAEPVVIEEEKKD